MCHILFSSVSSEVDTDPTRINNLRFNHLRAAESGPVITRSIFSKAPADAPKLAQEIEFMGMFGLHISPEPVFAIDATIILYCAIMWGRQWPAMRDHIIMRLHCRWHYTTEKHRKYYNVGEIRPFTQSEYKYTVISIRIREAIGKFCVYFSLVLKVKMIQFSLSTQKGVANLWVL